MNISLKQLNHSYKNNILLIACIAAYLLLCYFQQPRNTVNGGRGWDGTIYYEMAETLQFVDAVPVYNLRIFLPFLVHTFSDITNNHNFLQIYFMIGLVVTFLYMYFSFKILHSVFPQNNLRATYIIWLIIVTSELSPARTVFILPAATDYVHIFFIVLLFYLLILYSKLTSALSGRQSIGYLLGIFLCFFCGSLNREHFISNLALLSFLFIELIDNRIRFQLNTKTMLAFAAAATALILSYCIVLHVTHSSQFTSTMSVSVAVISVYPILQLLTAGFSTFGTFLLCFTNFRAFPVKRSNVYYHSFFWLLLSIIFAVIAGSNIERYLFWGTPFLGIIAVPIINSMFKAKNYLQIALLIVSCIFLQRLFFPMCKNGVGIHGINANYSVLEIFTGKGPLLHHWCQLATQEMCMNFLLVYMLIFFTNFAAGLYFHRKQNNNICC